MRRILVLAAALTAAICTHAAVIFEQPSEPGIGGHLYVPLAVHTPPPLGQFELVLWQTDSFNPGGMLVPTAWNAGTETGFTASSMLSQLGFRNVAGTSTAQMSGTAVGVYLNSADLPNQPAGTKMMITPEYQWPAGSQIKPFATNSPLGAAFDLQIPVAAGSNTYILADFFFVGPNGVQISYGVKIFHLGGGVGLLGMGYDQPSNSYMFNPPLLTGSSYLTPAANSGQQTDAVWTGWRHFNFSVNATQFTAALAALIAKFPTAGLSPNPALYTLTQWHLNAEFTFNPQPAALGWSMQNLKIWGGT